MRLYRRNISALGEPTLSEWAALFNWDWGLRVGGALLMGLGSGWAALCATGVCCRSPSPESSWRRAWSVFVAVTAWVLTLSVFQSDIRPAMRRRAAVSSPCAVRCGQWSLDERTTPPAGCLFRA